MELLHMDLAGWKRIPLAAVFPLILAGSCLAQMPASRPLTNADIVRMVNAGIPESVIVRVIEVSGTGFPATPDALVSLKQQRVPDSVLAAIVESQAPRMAPVGPPPGMVFVPGPPPPSGPHHLPNVDATVRLADKTVGKVQVRKNEIKVEKAGVPLLSVKWENAK
jgi:hypothetical protein